MSRLRQIVLLLLLIAGSVLFREAGAATGKSDTLEGWLTAVWVDAREGPPPGAAIEFWLTQRDGRRARLDAPPAQHARLLALDRRHVRLAGEHAPAAEPPPGRPAAAPVFRVRAAQAAPAPADAAAAEPIEPYAPSLGKRPWINLLCKFADRADEPRAPSYFTSMFASTKPGLDYYFKELSNSALSIAGSRASGWHTLPQPEDYYFNIFPDGYRALDVQRLLDDCTAAADADVHFPDYAGININVNGSLGCCSYGGAGSIALDGGWRTYGVTWMADWGWQNHGVFGHEMGHGMGLHHSKGNHQTYRNLWDVMSDIWYACHLNTDPLLGCLGQHMIAHAKDRAGWIPPAAKFHADPGTRTTIRLDRLERPMPGLYQMAQIPIGGSNSRFYTVEVRRKYGYDVRMPGASVVIHEVDETFAEAANVVDGDGNGDPYDGGTRWLVGETFHDARRGISVSVDGTDGGAGFMVTIESRDGRIFADNFDSGDLSRWTGGKLDGGDVSVSSAAAAAGTHGLQVVIDDNNQAHLTDHTPVRETSYVARFRFNPNGVAMADNDRFTIFGAYNDSWAIATVELRRSSGWYQLRATTRRDDGVYLVSPWTFIADGGYAHDVVLEWGASPDNQSNGWLRFTIDESVHADYVGIDNDTLTVERTLIGAVTGVDTGTRGTIYFDELITSRW